MMEVQPSRGRGLRMQGVGGRTQSKNRKWIAGQDHTTSGHTSDSERRDPSGHGRRRHRHGAGTPIVSSSPFLGVSDLHQLDDGASGTEDGHSMDGDTAGEEVDNDVDYPPDPETPQERERFWQELVKAREAERKKAISEGKMDDPTVPRRLDEAITMVGTCMDMCPRFERYRRERENNLDKWEVIPGTKRVDHKHAVKIYERAAGDKTLPSDLRPPPVLKRTLDYLFHDLLVREGFTQTYDFIRDRSRAVRSDITMQHEQGLLAIECHDRCARFHILALHLERNNPRFSVALEEQQLMNTLQSLKEFYEDQRGVYQAPTELEMRVYHRLIHIRDQKERREDVPEWITSHPVFQYTTQFRQIVQAKSAPITKMSRLTVDAEGMEIFGKLAAVLREQGNTVMIYLVACILERLFGKDTIDNIEAIRGDLTTPEIIDGISRPLAASSQPTQSITQPAPVPSGDISTKAEQATASTAPLASSAFADTVSPFASAVTSSTTLASSVHPAASAFGNLTPKPNPFGGNSIFRATSAFGTSPASSLATSTPSSSAGSIKSAFGGFANGNATLHERSGSQAPSHVFGGTSYPSNSSGLLSGQLATATTDRPFTKQTTTQANGSVFGTNISDPTSLNPMAATFTPPTLSSTSSSSTPLATAWRSPPTRSEPSSSTAQSQSRQVATTAPLFSAAPPATVSVLSSFASSAPSASVPFLAPSTQAPPLQGTSATSTPLSIPPFTMERQPLFSGLPVSASLQSQPRSQPQTPPSHTTASSSGSNLQTPGGSSSRPRISPLLPPTQEQLQTVPLPSTPTSRWFEPSPGKASAIPSIDRKKSNPGCPQLFMPPFNSAELLSPLQMSSPGFMSSSAVPSGSLSPSQVSVESPIRVQPETSPLTEKQSAIAKAKGKARDEPVDLEHILLQYLKTKDLEMIKHFYKRWEDRTIEHGRWMEACERGEAYKARVRRQGQRIPPTFSTPTMQSLQQGEEPKKRRMSAGELIRPKRMRRSAHYEHSLTDEELARRLKENHEESKMRWTTGTFLRSLRAHLKSINTKRRPLAEWRLWLAVNPFFDPTAIWLEKKFDAEPLGDFSIDLVTTIPAIPTPKPFPRGSPGLIVFERTPLERIKDNIEKRLRVLDDIVRLRDIAASLAPARDRRFIPTLVVVHWISKNEVDITEDFANETKKLLDKGTFKSMHVLSAPDISGRLDPLFSEFLKDVTLDLEDHLLEAMTWKALSKHFTTPFISAVSDWLDSCWSDDNFDWLRYEHVMVTILDLQHEVVRLVLGLLDAPQDAVVQRIADPESYVQFGKGHMMGPFVDALAKLSIETAERALAMNSSSRCTVEKARLERTLGDLDAAIRTHSGRLREKWLTAVSERSSSKRPAEDDESVLESLPSSHSQKRLRSDSGSSAEDIMPLTNGISVSPSPSIAPSLSTEDDKPYVSVAMLRSLTRDVLKTYGKHPK